MCARKRAHSLGLSRAKRTSARKLLSHGQTLMSTLPRRSRVCGNSARYTVNHVASKHRLGLVSGRCPTLKGLSRSPKRSGREIWIPRNEIPRLTT